MELPKKYKKEFEWSYTLGPFPTFELLSHAPELVRRVYAREDFRELMKLRELCGEKQAELQVGSKALERIAQKEICYAAGEFWKREGTLDGKRPHVALVNPSDMGNLGTILRTLLGFGIRDLAIVGTAADLWNPKVIRASMGAVFQMNVQHFQNFSQYEGQYGEGRRLFSFMLDGGTVLTSQSCPQVEKYTLIFGNEASGLPPEFQRFDSLFIRQSPAVDSLNLGISVAIGAFLFTQRNGYPE